MKHAKHTHVRPIKRPMSYPPPMFDRLREESERTGMAITEIVRRAIDLYFTSLK